MFKKKKKKLQYQWCSRKVSMFYKPCQPKFGYTSLFNPLTQKRSANQRKIYEMLLIYLGIPQCEESVVNLGDSFNDALTKVSCTKKINNSLIANIYSLLNLFSLVIKNRQHFSILYNFGISHEFQNQFP